MYGSITIPGATTTAPAGTSLPGSNGTACVPRTVAVDVGPGGQRVFSPSSVAVQLGDTVVFTFRSAGHTVDSVAAPSSCSFSSLFSSGGVQPVGQSFSLSVSAAGGFAVGSSVGFACSPHSSGMAGVLSVIACGSSLLFLTLPLSPLPAAMLPLCLRCLLLTRAHVSFLYTAHACRRLLCLLLIWRLLVPLSLGSAVGLSRLCPRGSGRRLPRLLRAGCRTSLLWRAPPPEGRIRRWDWPW